MPIASHRIVARNLNSEQIDTIIANAPERARRWAKVLDNAVDF
jgi:hypothetical protein